MTANSENRAKITLETLQEKKKNHQPIIFITAGDYPTALAADESGADGVVVGDALVSALLGLKNPNLVTMDDMLHHCKAVDRAVQRALKIGDMPFLSCHTGVHEAVRNAGRFIQEGGMDAVKIEGGEELADIISAIVQAGIPVIGHLDGSSLGMGSEDSDLFDEQVDRLFSAASTLEKCGCSAVVLVNFQPDLAGYITEDQTIPMIGIGSGPKCDGQVQRSNEMLGLRAGTPPSYIRKLADLHKVMVRAFTTFRHEVEDQIFPEPETSIQIPTDIWKTLHRGKHD